MSEPSDALRERIENTIRFLAVDAVERAGQLAVDPHRMQRRAVVGALLLLGGALLALSLGFRHSFGPAWKICIFRLYR